MFLMNINKKLIPMKMHYFFYTGCIATILSFGSTYAKQLGYSKITVGYIMVCLFILSMLTKPAVGAIVDKFHVKRHMFLVFIFFTGASAFLLMFVPKLPLEYVTELDCSTTATIRIYVNDSKKHSDCDEIRLMAINDTDLINCQLYCSDHEQLFSEMFTSRNITENQTLENDLNTSSYVHYKEVGYNYVSAFLYLKDRSTLEQLGFYHFGIKHVDLNNSTRLTWPSCLNPTKATCQMHCFNPTIMELSTPLKSQKSILFMSEFWQFFTLLCIFWISQSGIWTIQDQICFDLLDDRPDHFGKLRCWTSVGWGSISMLSGWLVDHYSDNGMYKNYTPVSILIVLFMSLNLIFAYNIEVVEFKPSKNTCQNVFKLFSKLHGLSFFLWVLMLGVYGSISMSLFWYVEDVTSENECDKLRWIKTLEGLSQAMQTFGGEMPIFFCSGWIINKIGHKHCMSLVLFAATLRLFFYTDIKNPVWMLPIEALNGMTYALGRAVSVSYSRTISPPSTNHTVIGLVGLFDCIGLSLGGVLAAHIHEYYGGDWLFRSYAYGSTVMCLVQITYNLCIESKEKTTFI